MASASGCWVEQRFVGLESLPFSPSNPHLPLPHPTTPPCISRDFYLNLSPLLLHKLSLSSRHSLSLALSPSTSLSHTYQLLHLTSTPGYILHPYSNSCLLKTTREGFVPFISNEKGGRLFPSFAQQCRRNTDKPPLDSVWLAVP